MQRDPKMQIMVGSVIEYANFSNEIVRVKVTALEADIKNGQPGFDGYVVNRDGSPVLDTTTDEDGPVLVWGYFSQVRRIVG